MDGWHWGQQPVDKHCLSRIGERWQLHQALGVIEQAFLCRINSWTVAFIVGDCSVRPHIVSCCNEGEMTRWADDLDCLLDDCYSATLIGCGSSLVDLGL